MRVEQLMSEATCCRPDDSVRDCARTMRDESIGFVPICDEKGAPIGAVTDRDLCIRVLAEGRTADEKLSSFMTRDVVGCRIGDDVEQVTNLMREHRTSRVMVCDRDGKLQGVISLADIAKATDDDTTGETLQEVKSDGPSMSAH